MERQFWMDCSQQGFKPVAQFAMPGKERGTTMHVRALVNLILFEPVGDVTRREIGSRPGGTIKHLIELFDGVDQQVTFLFADRGYVSANSIAEHGALLSRTLLGIRRKAVEV